MTSLNQHQNQHQNQSKTNKKNGAVARSGGSGGGSGKYEITTIIKYRTILLWFISISIIVLSCSQIYFFTPTNNTNNINTVDDDNNNNNNNNNNKSLISERRHSNSRISNSSKNRNNKQKKQNQLEGINKKTAKKEQQQQQQQQQRVIIMDVNLLLPLDVQVTSAASASKIKTASSKIKKLVKIKQTKVAKNIDGTYGTSNHLLDYNNRISNYNEYLLELLDMNMNMNMNSNNVNANGNNNAANANENNNNSSFLLPDIKKELEETKVIIEKSNYINNINNINNNENDDDDNNDEPWLVLHIGPPKTATTHIQCGLEKYSFRLAKEDKYHYLGGGCGVSEQEYIMPNSEETVLRRFLIIALHGNDNIQNHPQKQNSKEHNKGLQHLQKTLNRMSYLRKRKRNVILSGEQFGSQLSKRKSVMTYVRSILVGSSVSSGNKSNNNNNNNNDNNNSTMTTKTKTKMITAGYKPDKIRIVLAYRHFVDWLPSYYYQNELILDNTMDEEWIIHGPFSHVNKQKPNMHGRNGGRVQSFLKYADAYLTNWELHSNDILQWIDTIQKDSATTANANIKNKNSTTTTTTNLKNRRKQMLLMLPDDRHSIHPSWWLYSLWSSYFPLKNQVQVYDMHSPMNMNLNTDNKSNQQGDTMLTDFICHMLPTANKTCNKLLSNANANANANANTTTNNASPNDADNLVNYDEPYLHSRYSFLYPGREDKKMGIGGSSGGGTAGSDTADGSIDGTTSENNNKQSLIIRPSSDHHSTRIVEELLVRGDIEYFTYEDEDELKKYFHDESEYYEKYSDSTNMDDLSKKPFLNGSKKSILIELTKIILTDNGVLVSSSSKSSSSAVEEQQQPAFSEKYFDCMSSQLEERLLNASSTFMDLMYKHTPMLSLATAATFKTSATDDKDLIQKEKVKRWKQAKIEHERLFQKNKKKGKYCDINPDKVFQNNPKVYKMLTSLRYKPSYLRFKWDELPLLIKNNAQLLGYDSKLWSMGIKVSLIRTTLWKDLQWKYKLAAFQLGWDAERWNKFVEV